METLASVWACDPYDLGDLREQQQEPASVWGSPCALNSSPPAVLSWMEQLSPQLQRNKQLQDTLLQREEELARLQEENNKLRQFFNSSFVKDLEQKAKTLTAKGKRKLKRNLMNVDDGPLQSCSHQLLTSQQFSKRVCRNLTAEFCSESSETSRSSEPNLDLWVLRMLGLKDRDTIDTTNVSPSFSGNSLGTMVYDAAFTSSSSSEHTLNSSFSPSGAFSATSSARSSCQISTPPPDYGYKASDCQEANCLSPTSSTQSITTSPSPCSDFTVTELNRQFVAPEAIIRTYKPITAFETPPREISNNTSPNRAKVCSLITTSSPVQTLPRNNTNSLAFWSPLNDRQTQSEDMIQGSPPRQRVNLSPVASSTPVINQLRTPLYSCGPASSSSGSQPLTTPQTPQTPRSCTDLAFSMSLSPSSSVKTHSFPQGQAFVRKDTGGRWNFTWVPRQGP